MVKFVVSCTTAKEAALEIDTLRDNLDLDKGFEILSQRMKKKPSKNSEDFDVLVLEGIHLLLSLKFCLTMCSRNNEILSTFRDMYLTSRIGSKKHHDIYRASKS